jgi:hypothetical protein
MTTKEEGTKVERLKTDDYTQKQGKNPVLPLSPQIRTIGAGHRKQTHFEFVGMRGRGVRELAVRLR